MALWTLALANVCGLVCCWWLIRRLIQQRNRHEKIHELEQERAIGIHEAERTRRLELDDRLTTTSTHFEKRIAAIEDTLTKTALPQPAPPLFIGAFAPSDEQAAQIETRIREAEDHSLSATVVSPVPTSSVRSSRSANRSRRGPWTPGGSRFGTR